MAAVQTTPRCWMTSGLPSRAQQPHLAIASGARNQAQGFINKDRASGVCRQQQSLAYVEKHMEELLRLSSWSGSPMPMFGEHGALFDDDTCAKKFHDMEKAALMSVSTGAPDEDDVSISDVATTTSIEDTQKFRKVRFSDDIEVRHFFVQDGRAGATDKGRLLGSSRHSVNSATPSADDKRLSNKLPADVARMMTKDCLLGSPRQSFTGAMPSADDEFLRNKLPGDVALMMIKTENMMTEDRFLSSPHQPFTGATPSADDEFLRNRLPMDVANMMIKTEHLWEAAF